MKQKKYKTERQRRKAFQRHLNRLYSHFLKHDIWIKLSDMNQKINEPVQVVSLESLEKKKPNPFKDKPGLSYRTSVEAQIYFEAYSMFLRIWYAKTIEYPYAWNQLFWYSAAKRYCMNQFASNQIKVPSFESFITRFDRAQGFRAPFPAWSALFTVNHLPVFFVEVWREFREIMLDIGEIIRLLAVFIGIPYIRKRKPIKKIRQVSKRKLALPPFLRNIGGPSGIFEMIGMFFLPLAFIIAAIRIQKHQRFLTGDALVSKVNIAPDYLVPKLEQLIESSFDSNLADLLNETVPINDLKNDDNDSSIFIRDELTQWSEFFFKESFSSNPKIENTENIQRNNNELVQRFQENPVFEKDGQIVGNSSQAAEDIISFDNLENIEDIFDSLDDSPDIEDNNDIGDTGDKFDIDNVSETDSSLESSDKIQEVGKIEGITIPIAWQQAKVTISPYIRTFLHKIAQFGLEIRIYILENLKQYTDRSQIIWLQTIIIQIYRTKDRFISFKPIVNTISERFERIQSKLLELTPIYNAYTSQFELIVPQQPDRFIWYKIKEWQYYEIPREQQIALLEEQQIASSTGVSPRDLNGLTYIQHEGILETGQIEPEFYWGNENLKENSIGKEIESLDDAKIELLSDKQIDQLTVQDIEELTSEQIELLSDEQIDRLVDRQMESEFEQQIHDEVQEELDQELEGEMDKEFEDLIHQQIDEFLHRIRFQEEEDQEKNQEEDPEEDQEEDQEKTNILDLIFAWEDDDEYKEDVQKITYNISSNEAGETEFEENRLDNFIEVKLNSVKQIWDFYKGLIYTPSGFTWALDVFSRWYTILKARYVYAYTCFNDAIEYYTKDSLLYAKCENTFIAINRQLEDVWVEARELVHKQEVASRAESPRGPSDIGIYGHAMIAWLAFSMFIFSTGAVWLGIAYLNIWKLSESLLDMEYPSRYAEARFELEQYLFLKYLKEYYYLIYLPHGGPLFRMGNAFYTWRIKKKVVAKWLNDTRGGGDLARIHRSIFQKSLITPATLLKSPVKLKQKLGQSNYGDRFKWDNSLSALYNQIKTYHSGPTYALPFGLTRKLKELPYRVLYSAFYSDHTMISGTNTEKESYDFKQQNSMKQSVMPKYDWSWCNYTLELFPHRAYLLIGRQESGKSYLAKSIALNINLPLVYLGSRSIFRYLKDLLMELNFHNYTGMPPLLDRRIEAVSSSRRAEIFFKMEILFYLAERMAPCVVWIPTIQRYTTDWLKNARTDDMLRWFMVVILDMLERNRDRHSRRNILFLAGCDNTRYLDPMYLRPYRFNELVHLDNPGPFHREERMLGLLQTYGIGTSEDFSFTTIRNATMGYTMTEIASLVERIYGICSNLKLNKVSHILISEAIERKQVSTDFGFFANYEYTNSVQFAAYKLGKALIKRSVFPQPLFHVRRTYWVYQFYYLSKWVMEIRDRDSCISTNLILPYFYSNLAGLAAKDAWIMMCHNHIYHESGEMMHETFVTDVHLAVQLFRAYFSELSSLTFRNQNRQSENKPFSFIPATEWSTGRLLTVLGGFDVAKGHYLDADIEISLDYESSLFWQYDPNRFDLVQISSPYEERVPMYRNFIFEMDRHLSHSPSMYSVARYGLPQQIVQSYRQYLTDEEYWSDNPKWYNEYKSLELSDVVLLFDHGEEQFNFFRRRCIQMGWNQHYDIIELLNEHRLGGDPFIIYESRAIWNPKPIFPLQLQFEKKKVVANRLVMTILFNVYVDKPSDDPNKEPVPRPFWYRDEAQERIEDLIEEILRAARGQIETEEEKEERRRLKEEERNREFFHTHRMMVLPNLELLRPQLQTELTRTYDYFVGTMPLEGLSRYDTLCNQKLYECEKLVPMEIFVYQNLLGTYNSIYNWLMENKIMFLSLLQMLLEQGVLWPEQLDSFGNKNGLDELNKIIPPERIYDNYLKDQLLHPRMWFWRTIRTFFPGAGNPTKLAGMRRHETLRES